MGCSTCSSVKNEDGSVAGCKNNGGCSTGGCNKMNVFDWLSNMDIPDSNRFDIVEVGFKNGRKEFFRNSDNLDLVTGEAVVVDVPNGHHVGYVSLTGELVRLQMKKKQVANDDEVKSIYRIATAKDLEKLDKVKKREMPTLYRTRTIIDDLKLDMKLTDIEYQADNTKATFYYSADDRVDFRELIKILASEFKIRVEMRQISLRQEAGRLGGIGSCGRELCCSTWLADFKSVSTSAARYQNLSLNPSKLSGQCGRLKCCLNYELDTYMDALENIPEVEKPLVTEKGEATLQKTDIFRKIMWFGYANENTWHPVDVDRVAEILKLNSEGVTPATLAEDELAEELEVGGINSDLDQLDKKYKSKGKRNKRKNKRSNRGGDKNRSNQQAGNKNSNKRQASNKNSKQQGNNKQQPNNKQQGNNKPKNKGNQQQGNNNQGGGKQDGNKQGAPKNKKGNRPNNRKKNANKNRPQANKQSGDN
ncbi:MAG: Signal peptidase-like protein [bacterium]|nr:Signal peptidase-like protein [bacterium]